MTRTIIVHPGLPKCATSAIQRIFVLKDHALPRALGISTIGKKFIPMNGFPPITEVLRSYEECLRHLHGQRYADGRYFLSSEAITARPELLGEIKSIFDISQIVVTVRFPPIQAFSNFRYSGWLTEDLRCLLANPKTSPFQAAHRHRHKLRQFAGFARVVACPVEGDPDGFTLMQRFCMTCFGQTPDILHRTPFSDDGRVNDSIGLAFAQALSLEISERGLDFLGAERQRIVKLAQLAKVPAEFSYLMPAGFSQRDFTPLLDALGDYDMLLEEFGVSTRDRRAAVTSAERQLRALLERPAASSTQAVVLKSHAKALLDEALQASTI